MTVVDFELELNRLHNSDDPTLSSEHHSALVDKLMTKYHCSLLDMTDEQLLGEGKNKGIF